MPGQVFTEGTGQKDNGSGASASFYSFLCFVMFLYVIQSAAAGAKQIVQTSAIITSKSSPSVYTNSYASFQNLLQSLHVLSSMLSRLRTPRPAWTEALRTGYGQLLGWWKRVTMPAQLKMCPHCHLSAILNCQMGLNKHKQESTTCDPWKNKQASSTEPNHRTPHQQPCEGENVGTGSREGERGGGEESTQNI